MLRPEDVLRPSTAAGGQEVSSTGGQEVSSTCSEVAVREGLRAPCRHRALQEAWGTPGWDVSVRKDFLSNRLQSMWDTEGFYSLC